jgi:hypothetical protein
MLPADIVGYLVNDDALAAFFKTDAAKFGRNVRQNPPDCSKSAEHLPVAKPDIDANIDVFQHSSKTKFMAINQAESLAAEQLKAAFSRTFPDVTVLTGLIVSLPKESRIPTGEFDCLVVCNAGLFAFEVKAWKSCIVHRRKEGVRNRWFLDFKDKKENEVADPLAQGCEKLIGLRSHLDPRIKVRSYVLLPMEGVELDPTMPAGVITAPELPYIPRLLKSQVKASAQFSMLDSEMVGMLAGHLQELSQGNSLEVHIENCRRFHASKNFATALPTPLAGVIEV